MIPTAPRIWTTALAAAVALSACSPQPDGELRSDSIIVDGSSTVYPIAKEAARRYLRNHPDASIRVSYSGTTGGFRKFTGGATDIATASRPMNTEELRLAETNGVDFEEILLANDALAIVVHIGNRWVDHLTLDDLRKMWSSESEGTVTKWSDIRPEWPDREFKLFGRGADSGTMDYFSEQLSGTPREIREDYFRSEDEDLLARKIAAEPEAIGFFGIGGYHRHWDTIRVVSIDSGDGPVYPSLETVRSGTYTPFTRPLFLYVNTASAREKPDLVPFLANWLDDLETWLPFTGYLPLEKSDAETSKRKGNALAGD